VRGVPRGTPPPRGVPGGHWERCPRGTPLPKEQKDQIAVRGVPRGRGGQKEQSCASDSDCGAERGRGCVVSQGGQENGAGRGGERRASSLENGRGGAGGRVWRSLQVGRVQAVGRPRAAGRGGPSGPAPRCGRHPIPQAPLPRCACRRRSEGRSSNGRDAYRLRDHVGVWKCGVPDGSPL